MFRHAHHSYFICPTGKTISCRSLGNWYQLACKGQAIPQGKSGHFFFLFGGHEQSFVKKVLPVMESFKPLANADCL